MDRIDDAYNGLMGEEFMRKTRERLHWICSRVNGERVLDVGCSQGTLARLLAPLGKSILGVDVNKDAIAYAEGKLGELDESSRGRLCFVATNFMDFKSDEQFDTIVMGEILEHLPDPTSFVKKAWSHLSNGGIIVITVPFGINDDPDHKQTFYWTWIREVVAPFFDIGEVEFFGKWIGVVGKRRGHKATLEKAVPLSVVKEIEKAFYAVERPLVNDNKARGLRIQSQKKDVDEAKKSLAAKIAEAETIASGERDQKNRADKLAAEYAKLKTDLSAEIAKQKAALDKLAGEKVAADAAAAKQKTVLDGEVARQKTALAAEQAKVKDLNAKLAAARNELAATKNEALELRVNLDAEKKVSDCQLNQVSVLKAALQFAASRSQNDQNETKLLEYSQEVRELRAALESKRDEAVERAERLGNLSGQVDALKAEKELLASRMAELSSALVSEKESVKAKSVELAAKDVAVKEAGDYARLCESDNEKLCEENKSLAARIEELQSEKAALDAELKEAAAEKDRKDEAIQRIAGERTAFEQSLALLKRDVKARDDELDKMRGESCRFRDEAENAAEELRQAKESAARMASVLDKLREEANALHNANNELKGALRKSEEEVGERDRQLEALRLSMDALRAERDVGTKRVESLDAAQKKSSEQETALKKANEKLKADIAKALSQLANEKSNSATVSAELAKASAQIDSLKKSLAATEKNLAAQRKKADSESCAHKKFSAEAWQANKRIAVLEETVKTKDAEIARRAVDFEQLVAKQKLERESLNRALEKLRKKYDKLAKSKLGRLTLKWWQVKDGMKSADNDRHVISEAQSPAVMPKKVHERLPVETWAQQRSNESRYFAK